MDHTVTLSKVPEVTLGKADVVFKVKMRPASGTPKTKTLGTLKISEGTIEWWPANSKKVFFELDWTKFQRAVEKRQYRQSK